MSTHPYIPLYVDDFEAATAHLTAEEDGVYNRLLRLQWRTNGCTMPDDHAWIARRIRLSADDYERVAKPLIEEFFTTSRGRIFQARLRDEYETISRKVRARKEAGKKGGFAKAAKSKGNPASNATDLVADTRAYQNQNHIHNQDITPLPPSGGEGEAVASDPPAKPNGRGEGSRRKPERPLPEGFPDDELVAEAQQKAREVGANLDMRAFADRMRGWCVANDKRYRDWPAAWRNWYGREIDKAPKTAPLFDRDDGPTELTLDEQRRRMGFWTKSRYWSEEWGPKPSQPGCLVDPAILAEFGVRRREEILAELH